MKNNMRQFYIAVLMLVFALPAIAQRGSLKGIVTDLSAGENIPFATVAVLKAGEQNAFTGSVSDENGTFLIEKVPFGTYTLVVSFIGFKAKEIEEFTLSAANDDIDFGRIEIEPAVITVGAVDVTAASRTSVNKIDRKTYSATDFETARGGSAADVLSKLPSVSVDGEEGISVRGSSDFVVYLNGKPTNTSPSMLLSQIPADNIKSIDIITVPSSRFDAQGMGGIINITTKNIIDSGLTVAATGMTGGTPWKDGTDVYSGHRLDNNRVNGGLNLYYNKKRLGLYGSVNYTNRHNKGIGDIYTYIYQDETQPLQNTYYILDGMGARPKWDENLFTSFGVEYKTGENSRLSAGYQYSDRQSGRAAHYKYNTFFSGQTDGAPVGGTLYELFNPNDNHRNGSFQSVSVDYGLSGDAGSAFNASILYENSNLEQTIRNMEYAYQGEQKYYDYYSDETGNPVFHSFQKDVTPLDAYRLEVNYKKEFENGNSLDLGAVSQFVRLEGTYEYDTVNTTTGNFEGYDYFNNTIGLNRDVYAAYAEFSGNHENLTYLLGLRLEYLDQLMNVSSTAYFEEVYDVFEEVGRDFNEKEFRQNKPDLFPSLHLSYQAGEANTFSFAVSHRINRPPAKDMTPFLYRRHQEIFEMGDPLLEPEYSWNADLSFNRMLGRHTMILTGFVRQASNVIYRVNRLDYDLANTGGVLLRSFTNAGSQLAAGGELGFNFDILRKIKLFMGGSLYRFSVESDETLFGDQSSSSSLNYDAKTNLTWAIVAPLRFTVDYSYKSNSVTPQGEDFEFQMMNFALNYTPEKLQGWRFHAKLLDVIGTSQEGGFNGATSNGMKVFQRNWVYDYEGQIVEVGASFTFNQSKEKAKQRLIGNEYF
jgi:iron complex outermembrane recepter protein